VRIILSDKRDHSVHERVELQAFVTVAQIRRDTTIMNAIVQEGIDGTNTEVVMDDK
jgi:hypothetical protein